MHLVLVLSFCGLLSGLAVRFFDPLVTTIARDFDTTVGTVVLLASAFMLPFSLSQPLLGPLGDAIGKEKVLKTCLWLLGTCMALAALAASLDMLFLSRLATGLASGGLGPIMIALVGDRFPLAARQVALSRIVGALLFGQLLGAFAAGMLADLIGWRGAILAVAAVMLAGALVATLSLKEPEGIVRPPFRFADVVGRYRLVFRNRKSFVCYGTVFAEGIAVFGVLPYVADMLESQGQGGLRQAGIVVAGVALGGMLYSLSAGPVVRALGPRRMMVYGGAVAGLGLCGVSLALPWPVQAACFSVVGFGLFMLHTSIQSTVTDLAPTARGAAVSLHALSFSLGQALGPIVFGALRALAGAPASLVALAALVAAAGAFAAHALAGRHSTP